MAVGAVCHLAGAGAPGHPGSRLAWQGCHSGPMPASRSQTRRKGVISVFQICVRARRERPRVLLDCSEFVGHDANK